MGTTHARWLVVLVAAAACVLAVTLPGALRNARDDAEITGGASIPPAVMPLGGSGTVQVSIEAMPVPYAALKPFSSPTAGIDRARA